MEEIITIEKKDECLIKAPLGLDKIGSPTSKKMIRTENFEDLGCLNKETKKEIKKDYKGMICSDEGLIRVYTCEEIIDKKLKTIKTITGKDVFPYQIRNNNMIELEDTVVLETHQMYVQIDEKIRFPVFTCGIVNCVGLVIYKKEGFYPFTVVHYMSEFKRNFEPNSKIEKITDIHFLFEFCKRVGCYNLEGFSCKMVSCWLNENLVNMCRLMRLLGVEIEEIHCNYQMWNYGFGSKNKEFIDYHFDPRKYEIDILTYESFKVNCKDKDEEHRMSSSIYVNPEEKKIEVGKSICTQRVINENIIKLSTKSNDEYFKYE
jgi:hypothetical protein